MRQANGPAKDDASDVESAGVNPIGGPRHWRLAPARLLGFDRPRVMAILNLTPDSFYPGSRVEGVDAAVRAAERAMLEGADVLDLGAESTRPGAVRVDADEQIRRLIPVVESINLKLRGLGPVGAAGEATPPLLTVDTTLSRVAREAMGAGADAVNDVSGGLDDDQMLPLIAAQRRGVILMHRARLPEHDVLSTEYEREPEYGAARDGGVNGAVVGTVVKFLGERAGAALVAGVLAESIVLDPGLGFGKSVRQNLALIRHSPRIAGLGFAMLSALSRKSFVGAAAGLGKQVAASERLSATLGLSVAHLLAGARLFRVHDVRAHVEALGACWELMEGGGGWGGGLRRGVRLLGKSGEDGGEGMGLAAETEPPMGGVGLP